MPIEMHFHLQLPTFREMSCYSPEALMGLAKLTTESQRILIRNIVGIDALLTPTPEKETKIHPLRRCVQPLRNSIQDIPRGMNTLSRGMSIHVHFQVSELILCPYIKG